MADLDTIRFDVQEGNARAEVYRQHCVRLLLLIEEHIRQLDELEDELAALKGVEDEEDERMTGAA